MALLRLVVAAAALTFACAFEAADPEPGAAFNKEELEKILRAEHSTKISNVYDSERDPVRRVTPRATHAAAATAAAARRCRRRRCISRQRRHAAAALLPPAAAACALPPPRAHPACRSPRRRYTWNIELQELCAGVDGVCSKEEL